MSIKTFLSRIALVAGLYIIGISSVKQYIGGRLTNI